MLRPILAVALALTPAAALAHHGWSSYDESKPLKISTTLTDVAWENPHATAKTTYNGKSYTVILAPLARMEQRGFTRALASRGGPVGLEGYIRSDGTPEMRIETVVVDGKRIDLRTR